MNDIAKNLQSVKAPTDKPPGFTKQMWNEMKKYYEENYISQIPALKTRC